MFPKNNASSITIRKVYVLNIGLLMKLFYHIIPHARVIYFRSRYMGWFIYNLSYIFSCGLAAYLKTNLKDLN